jgi:hypothetical protein
MRILRVKFHIFIFNHIQRVLKVAILTNNMHIYKFLILQKRTQAKYIEYISWSLAVSPETYFFLFIFFILLLRSIFPAISTALTSVVVPQQRSKMFAFREEFCIFSRILSSLFTVNDVNFLLKL